MNPHVHLLVKIVKQSKEMFLRWCKIHAGYGFARIYVFDDGTTEWYNDAKKEVCEKYNNITFLNVDKRWNNRGEILSAYCKHCVNGDWGLILASNEFLYTDRWHKFDIRKFVGYAIRANHAHSVTIYKEYISDNDDYQFQRKRYNTYSASAEECPLSSAVLFSVQDRTVCPLANAFIPSDRNNWFDSNWNSLSVEDYINSVPVYSTYPVRVFKLFERNALSEEERAVFDEPDEVFWKYFLYMCPDFEPKYHEKGEFRKGIDELAREKAEAAKEANVPNENLPFEEDGEVIGVIMDAILHGKSFDEIVSVVKNGRINVSDEDIKLIYDRECYNVIYSNKPYVTLIKLLESGAKQKDMLKALHVSPKTLKQMKETLLMIPAEVKARFDNIEDVEDNAQSEIIPSNENEDI